MATTLRFILLGDDQASRAFNRLEKAVTTSSAAVDKHNASLARMTKANKDAANPLLALTAHVSGFGDAMTAASSKHNYLVRGIAAIGLATGPAEAAISALTGVVGSLSAALVAGGLGIGAYGLAVIPVFSQVSELLKKQQSALTGGKAAQAAYQKQLAATPKPLREFAKQLTATQKAYKNWATSLTSFTLRPLTGGLKLVNPLLHDLTPFVQQASLAFAELVRQMGQGIRSTGFTKWMQTMLPLVQPVIIQLGTAIGHVVVGLGGIAKAFAPFATTVLTGLDNLTGSFARWGTTLTGHSGFQAMIKQWQDNWPVVHQTLKQLWAILKNIVSTWAWMTTPGNSKAMWELANPLLALAVSLSSHKELVAALTYLVLIGKGAGQIKGVFSVMKGAWDSLGKTLSMVTGGKFGWAASANTQMAAAKLQDVAADKQLRAAGLGGGPGVGPEGKAAKGEGALSRLGKIGLGAGLTLGIPIAISTQVHLPGQKESIWQGVIKSARESFGPGSPLANALGSVFSPNGWINRTATAGLVGLGRALGSAFTPGGALNQSMLRGLEGLGKSIGGFFTSAFTPGGKINQDAIHAGADLIRGFVNGIKTAWDTAWGWVKARPAAIIDWFKRQLGIGSPSTVFFAIGKDIMLGLWHGIVFVWDKASAWIRAVPGRIAGFFRGTLSLLVTAGRNIFWGLWNGLMSVWDRTVRPWLSGMPSRVGNFFRGALGWLYAGGRNVFWGLYNGMLFVWSKIKSFVSGIASWIKAHKGPIALDQRLLRPAGQALMQGLHSGLVLGSQGPLGFVSGLAGTIGGLLGKGLGAVQAALAAHYGGGTIVSDAMSWLGQIPYVWGGTAVPGGADCSGFVQTIYGRHGLFAPRTSEAQGGWVKRGGPVPGGLAFYHSPGGGPDPGHVAIVRNANQVISQGGGMGPQLEALRFMPLLWTGVPPGGFKAGGPVGGLQPGMGAGGGGTVALGKAMAAAYGWTGSQWTNLYNLWMRESGWSATARNPSSGAAGIPQDITGNFHGGARGQIAWGLNYIKGRYGTPWWAWLHEMRTGWYGEGGPITEPIAGVGMRTGRPYGFGEAGNEYVSSQADLKTVAKLLSAVLGELRQLNAHAASNPGRTGHAVAVGLNSAAGLAALGR